MAKIRYCTLAMFLLVAFTFTYAGETSMRVEKVPAFYVIGKMGQGSAENKDAWIPPLWTATSDNVNEIAGHIKHDTNGLPSGIWAIMSDSGESFKPWDASGGKYLAGFEASDGSPAPDGWTKWRVPGYEYIVIETSLTNYGEAFTHTITTLLPGKGLTLAGAVHERYPAPNDPTLVELYFPVRQLAETAVD